MRRTPIAHVVFPRPSALRPVAEFVWDAVDALTATRDLDVGVYIPVPWAGGRPLQGWVRELRGADPYPAGLEEALTQLEPRPTLVPYLPVPGRGTESAAAALSVALSQLPRGGRPKLIHGSFLDQGGYAAVVVARVLGVPSIGVAHGTDVRVLRGRVEGRRRQRRALRTAQGATRIVAVSSALAADLAYTGIRAEVVPFTARGDRFPLARDAAKEPMILFVGRISREKGVDLLLDAFVRLKRPEVRCRLVGPKVAGFDLDRELAARSLTDRVTWDGEVAQGHLPLRYAQATLLALPSRGEGLPSVIAEALLTGRPVVASDVGGVSELVDSTTGAVVPPENVGALTDALGAVLDRTFDPAVLRARGLDAAWDTSGPRLAEITREVLQG